MTIPFPVAVCLAILATYRIARLVAYDGIFSGLRGMVSRFASAEMESGIRRKLTGRYSSKSARIELEMRRYYRFSSALLYFINCAFCIGVWVGAAFGILICWQYEISSISLIILVCCGVIGGQAVLEDLLGGTNDRPN